jgi:hypothetical protein
LIIYGEREAVCNRIKKAVSHQYKIQAGLLYDFPDGDYEYFMFLVKAISEMDTAKVEPIYLRFEKGLLVGVRSSLAVGITDDISWGRKTPKY